jgi:hypothetical protein
MRVVVLGVFLSVVVLIPKMSTAQVYYSPTAAPAVTAAGTHWYAAGDPIFYSGNFYYPTGPTVFFDGNVMDRTGNYYGVPLYEDATLEPYSIVYVPIGTTLMRPYERRREGELVGTVGSRMPSFPIQRDVEFSAASGFTGIQVPPLLGAPGAPEPMPMPEAFRVPVPNPPLVVTLPQDVRITGAIDVRIVRPDTTPPAPGAAAVRPGAGASPAPAAPAASPAPASDGVWVEFRGTRYYSAGPSVLYDADRFVNIGEDRGFPVYREARGPSDRIYVAVLPDGPLAPFTKR